MFGEILGTLGTILLLAFLIETLVEALFGRIVDHVPALLPYKWALIYVAVAAGIAGAWVYQFDVIYLASRFMEAPVNITPFGMTVTGIAIGMGAGYIHQIISTYFPPKQPLG
jgi:nitrate/nitrite transporter NarK